jgi:hypothetical protein
MSPTIIRGHDSYFDDPKKDIVQRLRALAKEYGFGAPGEAADRIEALERELEQWSAVKVHRIESLEAALREIANSTQYDRMCHDWCCDAARRALEFGAGNTERSVRASGAGTPNCPPPALNDTPDGKP